MIKLKIRNEFQEWSEDALKDLSTERGHGQATNPYFIKEYDHDKWRTGRVYEFNTLRELKHFADQAIKEIEYSEDHSECFSNWDWQEIDIDLTISEDEENLIILSIDAHDEWRD